METEISPYSWSPITWNKNSPPQDASHHLGWGSHFWVWESQPKPSLLTIASWVAPFGNDDLAGLPLSWSILLVCGEVWTCSNFSFLGRQLLFVAFFWMLQNSKFESFFLQFITIVYLYRLFTSDVSLLSHPKSRIPTWSSAPGRSWRSSGVADGETTIFHVKIWNRPTNRFLKWMANRFPGWYEWFPGLAHEIFHVSSPTNIIWITPVVIG